MLRHDFCVFLAHSKFPVCPSRLRRLVCKGNLNSTIIQHLYKLGFVIPSSDLCWFFLVQDMILTHRKSMKLLSDHCVGPCKLDVFSTVAKSMKVSQTSTHYKFVNFLSKWIFLNMAAMCWNDNQSTIVADGIHTVPTGGGRSYVFTAEAIQPYVTQSQMIIDSTCAFKFIDHIDSEAQTSFPTDQKFVYANVPLINLVSHIPINMVHKIAHIHSISLGSHVPKKDIPAYFDNHSCQSCSIHVSVFAMEKSRHTKALEYRTEKSADPQHVDKLNAKKRHQYAVDRSKLLEQRRLSDESEPIKNNKSSSAVKCKVKFNSGLPESAPFPPPPLSESLSHTVVSNFCADTMPRVFQEAGCAVCGELVPLSNLSRLKSVRGILGILQTTGITRIERKNSTERIREYQEPVLDYRCDRICDTCRACIRKGKIPRLALAQGLWLGEVPSVLSQLHFVEKLLVARIRHNCCFVRVASGMRKMTSHVVAFESPIPKVYTALPPPIEDLDEVLAILFTGPCKPTEKDFARTPLLVRRNHVARALEWLKLNHCDYQDLEISYDNLAKYPEDGPPVSVEYRHAMTNKVPEGTSVFDNECEDGTEEGECPFVVHGLTGEHLDTKSVNSLKGIALEHLNKGGKVLAIGHGSNPESIYKNPGLYPQIFPWLFPYGMGGIGSTSLSDQEHKRHLLMYHDKRFQTDINFPFVAFSHAQVKASTTGGFLLAEKAKFHDITDRLLSVSQDVLSSLAKRLSDGEVVKPATQQEKDCFQIIRDLDHISGRVDGSTTTKKHMRNEIWSLICHHGAPSWYITLSPADVKHPICLYFADTKETFEPSIRASDDRFRLIAKNPVAGARFFHFMVELFIKHVLGVGTDHSGIYGDTSAYYGTVEQQGRLTLHLHLLLWIIGCLTPHEIRKRIMDPNSDFQKKIIEYLESTHISEFLTGSQEVVLSNIEKASQMSGYMDPTQTLPVPPPLPCKKRCGQCKRCSDLKSWGNKFDFTVDDIMAKSNIHTCTSNRNKDGTVNKARQYVGCLNNKWGKCKARFPRPIFQTTEVDTETGALNMKKWESMINTVTPLVTYLFRCNTDVTSLKSGTALKAVILYVSDYITKASLKTHVIFDTVCAMFHKNSEMIGGSDARKEKARRLMTKIVNSLSVKMEIGALMACMYLLQNPDHYTNYKFVTFYWQSYVQNVQNAWNPKPVTDFPEKVTLMKQHGRIIGLSQVYDYIYRPTELEDLNLYEWIGRCTRQKINKKLENSHLNQQDLDDDDQASDNEESYTKSGPDSHNDSLPSDSNLHVGSSTTDVGTFSFLDCHPLSQTHAAHCVSQDKALLPNL